MLFLVKWSTDVQKWDFILMLVNGSLFSLFCFFIICWSWDRPIVMRFIRICFDHYSFSVFSSHFFWQHNPCTKSLVNGRVQRDFAHWKALKSIQELTNCTVKKGDWWYWSCGFRKKWVHCTTEFKWISIACSKRISFEAFCCFEKKRQKRTKKKTTLQSDWFWDLCCHISLSLSHEGFPVFLCHNVTVFLFSSFWRIHGIHWHISAVCIVSVLTYGMFLPQFVIKCGSIYWQHCTNSTSHIVFLQSGSFVHVRGEILP